MSKVTFIPRKLDGVELYALLAKYNVEQSVSLMVGYSRGVNISHNEVYNIKQESISHDDGVGIDLDINAANCIAEYNYVHDNEGCGFYHFEAGNTNVYRFNVSVNNGLGASTHKPYEFCSASAQATNLYVYNNTFIALKSGTEACAIAYQLYGTNIFANNIFVTVGANVLEANHSANIRLYGNDYYVTNGSTVTFSWNGIGYGNWGAFTNGVPGQELGVGTTNNPTFANGFVVAETDDASRLTSQTNYVLLSSSPILGAGKNLNSLFGFVMPAVDYRGQSLPGSGYSIGACNQAYP